METAAGTAAGAAAGSRLEMLLVTNFEDFPERWTSPGNGLSGTAAYAETAADYLRLGKDAESILVVNCDPRLTLELAARQLISTRRRPVIPVDLVLRRPRTFSGRISLPLKRVLFGRVDHFIHYFEDVRGMDEVFGIDAARSSFVPFKANLWKFRSAAPAPDGEYVLCFGRSIRDFDTFFDAMDAVPYPGAIVDPKVAGVWNDGSRFTRALKDLPANIRIMDHDLSPGSQADLLAGAKIVVIPILKEAIVSAVSTILNAMALGKCVIATAGPGVTDILRNEVLSVPPEDSRALAATIREAWEDDELRARLAGLGHRYAEQCGSIQDFYQRVIDRVAGWWVEHERA